MLYWVSYASLGQAVKITRLYGWEFSGIKRWREKETTAQFLLVTDTQFSFFKV